MGRLIHILADDAARCSNGLHVYRSGFAGQDVSGAAPVLWDDSFNHELLGYDFYVSEVTTDRSQWESNGNAYVDSLGRVWMLGADWVYDPSTMGTSFQSVTFNPATCGLTPRYIINHPIANLSNPYDRPQGIKSMVERPAGGHYAVAYTSAFTDDTGAPIGNPIVFWDEGNLAAGSTGSNADDPAQWYWETGAQSVWSGVAQVYKYGSLSRTAGDIWWEGTPALIFRHASAYWCVARGYFYHLNSGVRQQIGYGYGWCVLKTTGDPADAGSWFTSTAVQGFLTQYADPSTGIHWEDAWSYTDNAGPLLSVIEHGGSAYVTTGMSVSLDHTGYTYPATSTSIWRISSGGAISSDFLLPDAPTTDGPWSVQGPTASYDGELYTVTCYGNMNWYSYGPGSYSWGTAQSHVKLQVWKRNATTGVWASVGLPYTVPLTYSGFPLAQEPSWPVQMIGSGGRLLMLMSVNYFQENHAGRYVYLYEFDVTTLSWTRVSLGENQGSWTDVNSRQRYFFFSGPVIP